MLCLSSAVGEPGLVQNPTLRFKAKASSTFLCKSGQTLLPCLLRTGPNPLRGRPCIPCPSLLTFWLVAAFLPGKSGQEAPLSGWVTSVPALGRGSGFFFPLLLVLAGEGGEGRRVSQRPGNAGACRNPLSGHSWALNFLEPLEEGRKKEGSAGAREPAPKAGVQPWNGRPGAKEACAL